MSYAFASPHASGPKYDWTEEHIDLLKRLVAEGLSSGEIARELGVSRNAVIGKIHRLGIQLKRSTGSTGPKTSAQRRTRFQRGKLKTERIRQKAIRDKVSRYGNPVAVAKRAPSEIEIDNSAENPVSFMELQTGQCRWPIGELFCGDAQAKDSSYCARHHRKSHSR